MSRPSTATEWYVYVIQSSTTGRLYTGISPDPDKRLLRHNGEIRGGARSTRSGRPWVIVYLEGPFPKGAALKREAAIKALKRSQKRTLIADSCLHEVKAFLCIKCGHKFIPPTPESHQEQ